jgi:hypothetical protein
MTNCCDDYGNCNQGRDCPARVARSRAVMRAADPLPPSTWRQQLWHLAEWMLFGLVGVLWLSFLVVCTYAYLS